MRHPVDFEGETVLVTGASSGIGRDTALAFARRGASLILVARRRNLLESLRDAIHEKGGQAAAVPCDVSDQAAVQKAAADILESGCPDILVNNAGFAVFGNVLDVAIPDIESQMATNYMGMIYVTKAFLPCMVERGSGHIVNVASVAASFGLPGAASYCASKSAMLGFSEGLRHELSGTGVGVTVVSPITVRTEFFGGAQTPGYSVSSASVASCILRAARSPRAEITVPGMARLAIWAKHGIPYLTDSVIARIFSKRARRWMQDRNTK